MTVVIDPAAVIPAAVAMISRGIQPEIITDNETGAKYLAGLYPPDGSPAGIAMTMTAIGMPWSWWKNGRYVVPERKKSALAGLTIIENGKARIA